jgi:protein O-GlcNAc transferase
VSAPLSPDEAMQLALQHHRARDLPRAESIYRQILAVDPNHADALHLLGCIAHQVGRYEDAIQIISRAIAIRPNVADYHTNLGEAFSLIGRIDQAIACYRTAIRLRPALMQSYNNLAIVLLSQNKLDDAESVMRSASSVDPKDPSIWSNLGIIQSRQEKFGDALASFDRAVTLAPTYAEAHENKAVTLMSLGRWGDAVAALREAQKLAPDRVSILNNLGTAYQMEGFVRQAIDCFEQAIARDAHFPGAHSNLLLALHYVPGFTRQEVFQRHVEWGRRYAILPSPPPSSGAPREAEQTRRLKVGFVSSDFRVHSVAFFIEPLLETRDRTDWEVFCYSDVQAADVVTQRFERLADVWRDLRGISDAQAAQIIQDDRIDILIDLQGHTGLNRLLVFARKPAPIQITWLGYPDTTGLSQIDYRLTDIWADPPGDGDEFHTERLIRLDRCAWCYRPPQSAPPVAQMSPCQRPDANGITFGSFNTLAKINDELLSVWSKILHRVPNSRLLLKADGLSDPAAQERILDIMSRHGIARGRLDIRARTGSLDAHFKTYHSIDIALDAFPYHGTTTTCDALYMGVPVVTLAGDRHVSRVGVSLLTAVGLPELIATTEDAYIQAACGLAVPSILRSLHPTLRPRMQKSALMDSTSHARAIHRALRQIWITHSQPVRTSP